MIIKINKENFSAIKSDEIKNITDKAIINVDDIFFDKERAEVRIKLQKYILERKENFIDIFLNHKRKQKKTFFLTIKNVSHCSIQNRLSENDSKFIHVLFGIKIDEDSIYFSSAEEFQGEECYSMTIESRNFDISFYDSESNFS